MRAMFAVVLATAIGYACGTLPWGLWLGRWVKGVDVRRVGSGNPGATNVYRTLGPGLGIATLVLDMLKGAIPVWIVPRLPIETAFPGGPDAVALAVGLAAIAGHVWSFLLGFRGGKGVATTAGVLLALAPRAFAVFAAVFVITVAITRFVSLGSVLGAIAFALALGTAGWRSPRFVFGVAVALLVLLRHRENLRRLARGEERRFSLRRTPS